jgi:hypothetical protein
MDEGWMYGLMGSCRPCTDRTVEGNIVPQDLRENRPTDLQTDRPTDRQTDRPNVRKACNKTETQLSFLGKPIQLDSVPLISPTNKPPPAIPLTTVREMSYVLYVAK